MPDSTRSSGPRKRASRPPPRLRPCPVWLKLLLFWFVKAAIALSVIGALLISYVLIVMVPNLPSLEVLTDYRPKVPLRVYTRDYVLIGEFGEQRRQPVKLQAVPAMMKNAVLAIEDNRFYAHGGVDFIGIFRAGLADILHGGAAQGASTITMQVARNFFLSSEKTYIRKLYEMLLAYKIESALTKDQILELYMNQIYLGQRAYGFAAAARTYFGKNLQEITLAQAAMLAGLPKAPSLYNPIANLKRAKKRQEYILKRMLDLQYINAAQYQQALHEAVLVKSIGNEFSVHAEFAAEMVRQSICAQYPNEAYTRGLNVITTIDSADQAAAYQAVKKGVLDYEQRRGHRGNDNVQGAFISLSPQEGAIRALVGGRDFNKSKFNHITQAWRQPGSSFKPFIYSAALEKGVGPATIIEDAPLHFSAAQTGTQPWEPKNYGGRYEGPITMRTALKKSKNLVSIRILNYIGTQYAQTYLARFGFDIDKHPAYLPMALGAGLVTPMQMAVGYAVFANGGYRVSPYLIAEVADTHGRVLLETQPLVAGQNAPQTLEARNAYLMTDLLLSVAQQGTGARSNVLHRKDLGGKTGTTNDSHDAWFAGFQRTIVAIAWLGYDQPKSLGDRETGWKLALPIWIDYMRHALQGVPPYRAPKPPDIAEINGELYYDNFTPGHGFVEHIDFNPNAAVAPVNNNNNSNSNSPDDSFGANLLNRNKLPGERSLNSPPNDANDVNGQKGAFDSFSADHKKVDDAERRSIINIFRGQ